MEESKNNDWREKAACMGSDTDIFFPPILSESEEALKICADCTVQAECLEYALATKQETGVWGGMRESDRKRILEQRNKLIS